VIFRTLGFGEWIDDGHGTSAVGSGMKEAENGGGHCYSTVNTNSRTYGLWTYIFPNLTNMNICVPFMSIFIIRYYGYGLGSICLLNVWNVEAAGCHGKWQSLEL
jgi:hypothetical protein